MKTLRLFFIVLLSFLGMFLSLWSIWVHSNLRFGIAAQSFCNINASLNCETVLQSPYATFLGAPLGVYGLFYYLAFIILAVHVHKPHGDEEPRALSDFLLLISLLSIVVSIVLFLISHFQIGVLCPICLAMYTVNTLLFLLVLFLQPISQIMHRLARSVPGVLTLAKHDSKHTGWITVELSIVFLFSFLIPHGFDYYQGQRLFQGLVRDFLSQPQLEIPEMRQDGVSRDFFQGNKDAPIRLVEFFDYQCPACRDLFDTIEQIAQEFPQMLRIEYRNYPLDQSCNPIIQQSFHDNACQAAMFSRCAGLQDKFSAAHLFLMTLQDLDLDVDPTRFREALTQGMVTLHLDSDEMQTCMASKEQRAKVQRDIMLGEMLGLQGTPSVWINGRFVKNPNEEAL